MIIKEGQSFLKLVHYPFTTKCSKLQKIAVIANWCRIITNYDRYYTLGQKDKIRLDIFCLFDSASSLHFNDFFE